MAACLAFFGKVLVQQLGRLRKSNGLEPAEKRATADLLADFSRFVGEVDLPKATRSRVDVLAAHLPEVAARQAADQSDFPSCVVHFCSFLRQQSQDPRIVDFSLKACKLLDAQIARQAQQSAMARSLAITIISSWRLTKALTVRAQTIAA